MKKLFSTLLAMACIGLMTACIPDNNSENGGDENGDGKNENVTPEEMKEKGFALKYDYFTEYGKDTHQQQPGAHPLQPDGHRQAPPTEGQNLYRLE